LTSSNFFCKHAYDRLLNYPQDPRDISSHQEVYFAHVARKYSVSRGMFVLFIKRIPLFLARIPEERTTGNGYQRHKMESVAAQDWYPRNLPKIYTTKVHRHANARPKPRNARRISGGAIRCSQVPVPSDDDDDDDNDGDGSGGEGIVARAIQTREKTSEIPGKEAVLHKSPKRESYRRHGVFES